MLVGELWRYPVKSLAGEPLVSVAVGRLGVDGDRQRAVVDSESGVSLSAKRYGQLLLCQAWTENSLVMVALPDGSVFDADSPDTAEGLSEFLDRRVEIRRAKAGEPVRHEFTTDTSTDSGEAMVVEAPLTEAFFDGLSVHLLTEATLREFARHQPESTFHRARFRPNILVSSDDEGFVEDDWVGSHINVGEVSFRVVKHKTRCVMTTRPQGNLNLDRDVLKTVGRVNQRRAGIEPVEHRPGCFPSAGATSPAVPRSPAG